MILLGKQDCQYPFAQMVEASVFLAKYYLYQTIISVPKTDHQESGLSGLRDPSNDSTIEFGDIEKAAERGRGVQQPRYCRKQPEKYS